MAIKATAQVQTPPVKGDTWIELHSRDAGVGAEVRLLWLQGTENVKVELLFCGEVVATIETPPDKALEMFFHPLALTDENPWEAR